MRIHHRALSLFAASLIGLAPINAVAQTPNDTTREEPVSVRDRPRPEYDAPGVRLGGFYLRAALDLSITSTDNLFAAPDGFEIDDIVYRVTPTARLASDWSRHAVAVEAGASWITHEDVSNEDAETYYLRGNGRLDIGTSSRLYGAARAAHQVSPRTDPDAPLAGAPVEYDRIDASIGAEHRFARVTVRADLDRSEYDYEGVQNFRDNEETALRGRVEVDLWPRVDLVLQAVADDREYKNSPNLDSEGQALLVGARIDADLLSGEVSVGGFERDYADPALGTFDGLAVAAQLDWYATRLTTVSFAARRNADDQIGATAGLPYITTEYGARVDHELLRNVILTAGVQAGTREYESIDREDDYSRVDVGADYMLNRRAAIRFRYEHDETNSSGGLAYRDFDANAVTVGLSLRL